MDRHRLAELRSIALHKAVGQKLLLKPELVEETRLRVESLYQEGKLAQFYRDEWQAVLRQPLEQLVTFLSDDSEHARELRQATPFAGIIGPRERWQIWKSVLQVA